VFTAPAAHGAERPSCLECSADGRFLVCATDKGVRVFAWDELLAAANSTPPPVFSVGAEPVAVEMGQGTATVPGHFLALVHDAAGGRLLFSGVEGKVRFLDLQSGQTGVLLDPPGRPGILRLGLSRDRSSLCCLCQPGLFDGRHPQAPVLQLWNYATLSV
jgi:hypothetical protein